MRAQTTRRLQLSFSKAQLSQEQWETFFPSVANLVSDRMSGLVWRDNACSASFVHVLTMFQGLEKLEFDGSLPRSDERATILSSLCELIRQSTSLTSLSLGDGSSAYKWTAEECQMVAQAIGENRSLVNVTLTCADAAKELLLAMEQPIMSNRVITSLTLLPVRDISVYAKVWETWKGRGVPLRIPFPTSLTPSSTGDNWASLFMSYKAIVAGNKDVQVPPETLTPRRSAPQHMSPEPIQPMEPRPLSGALIGNEQIEFADRDDLPPGDGEAWEVDLPAIPPLNNTFVPALFTTELAVDPMIQVFHQRS